MTEELVKAAGVRALRTALEYISTSIPAGLVITPAMLQHLDPKWMALVAVAWVLTGALQCLAAFAAGIMTGLPEVDDDEDPTEEDEDDECEKVED